MSPEADRAVADLPGAIVRMAKAFERIALVMEADAPPSISDALNELPNAPSRPVTASDEEAVGIGKSDAHAKGADDFAISWERGLYYLEVDGKRLFYFRNGLPKFWEKAITEAIKTDGLGGKDDIGDGERKRIADISDPSGAGMYWTPGAGDSASKFDVEDVDPRYMTDVILEAFTEGDKKYLLLNVLGKLHPESQSYALVRRIADAEGIYTAHGG